MGKLLSELMFLTLFGFCRDEKTLGDAWQGGERISLARLFKYFNDGQLKVPGKISSEDGEVQAHRSKFEGGVLGSSPHTDWGLLTLIVVCGMWYMVCGM